MKIRTLPPLHYVIVGLFLTGLLCLIPIFSGCQTAPNERVAVVNSLLAVGHSAEATIALSAHAFHDGRITNAQAKAINEFYTTRFLPAYSAAVYAAGSNLNSASAPSDVIAIAAQLAAMIPVNP